MEKITALTSADIVADNIQLLKQLFPTIVKEDKIDLNELKALLGESVEEKEEYYRFIWAGKNQARLEANKPTTATLRPNKEDSKDWDTTGNVFIEGDNLEVLKLLQKSYANKIKMIYIDPPYNTGKDFVYKDNYADNLGNYLNITGQTDEQGKKTSTNTESDGRYHSNWLNMMYPRLRLARNLMTDDGVIFISIDDNEVHNLRKLCDEIFGEDNFISEIIIKSNPRGSQSKASVAELHEYILVYSKNYIFSDISGIELRDEMISEYKYLDDNNNKYRLLGLRQRGGFWRRKDRPNLHFPFYVNPNNGNLSLLEDVNYSYEVLPIQPSTSEDGTWRWSKEKIKSEMDLLVAKKVNRDNEIVWDIFQKDYLQKEGKDKKTKVKSIWDDKEFNYQNGTTEVKNLIGSGIFDFCKPKYLIEYSANLLDLQNEIILDFFAGSGTTAHAVMQLNADDGGNRKCISVQLPEPTDEKSEAFKAGYATIAEITKERIRRAGEKIKQDFKDKEGIEKLDIGFKAFKLDSSNIVAWDGNPDNLAEQLDAFANNIKTDRTEEDILFEILLKYGLDLTVAIEEKTIAKQNVYSVGLGTLFICLSNNITPEVSEGIGAWKQELNPTRCRVIFKDTGFASDKDKVNAMQILKRFGVEEVNSI